jgi:hypothetical protein
VLWAAFACNLLAAILAFFCLKPMIAKITVRRDVSAPSTPASSRLVGSR